MKSGLVVAVAVVLLVSGCADVRVPAAGQTPGPVVMTVKQAAARYRSIVGPVNDAVDNMNAAGDDSFAEFQYYAPTTGLTFVTAYKEFGSTQTWPQRVRHDIDVQKALFLDEVRAMSGVALATNDATILKVEGPSESEQDKDYKATSELRKALGLPQGDEEF